MVAIRWLECLRFGFNSRELYGNHYRRCFLNGHCIRDYYPAGSGVEYHIICANQRGLFWWFYGSCNGECLWRNRSLLVLVGSFWRNGCNSQQLGLRYVHGYGDRCQFLHRCAELYHHPTGGGFERYRCFANQRGLQWWIYRIRYGKRNRWNRNLYIFLGSFRRNQYYCEQFVCRYVHGYSDGC